MRHVISDVTDRELLDNLREEVRLTLEMDGEHARCASTGKVKVGVHFDGQGHRRSHNNCHKSNCVWAHANGYYTNKPVWKGHMYMNCIDCVYDRLYEERNPGKKRGPHECRPPPSCI